MTGIYVENDQERPVEYNRVENTLLWSDR
jgi:hypothetical protein